MTTFHRLYHAALCEGCLGRDHIYAAREPCGPLNHLPTELRRLASPYHVTLGRIVRGRIKHLDRLALVCLGWFGWLLFGSMGLPLGILGADA